jgi:hypothetical protein
MRCVARADDGDRQRVLRLDPALHEQHARRIMNFAQHPRIAGHVLSEHFDLLLPAQFQLGFGIDIIARRRQSGRQLGSDARHVSQVARRRTQHPCRRTEPLEEQFPQSRADAVDQRQP